MWITIKMAFHHIRILVLYMVLHGNVISTESSLLSNQKIIISKLNSLDAKLTAHVQSQAVIKDCSEVFKNGKKLNGVYTIYPSDKKGPVSVYCDMKTDGGGWTVFQRRQDGSVDFYRGWKSYKHGFGNLNGEFWLGNDIISRLTNQNRYELRVDLQDTSGNNVYAKYNFFAISSERSKYSLSLGTYSGTAGDSLTYHKGASFSTKDNDNDSHSDHCAIQFKGAWWYNGCHKSNLNGLYHHGKHSSASDGVNWVHFKGYNYSLKKTEMKIRPIGFKGKK